MMNRRIVLIGLAAPALSGCGRKGPLEPPPDPSAKTPEAAPAANPFGAPRRVKKIRTPINVPKDPFVLDPIL